MPTLMLRGLDPALMARVKSYAERWQIGRSAAAVRLMEAGADHLDARSAGGSKSYAKLTDAERTELGKAGAAARWGK